MAQIPESAPRDASKRPDLFDPQITQIGRFHGEAMEQYPRTFAIIGAAMELHRVLGPGFLDAAYHEALARELARHAIPFRSEVELPVFYKGERLSTSYRCDFVCYDTVIVEVKALAPVSGLEEAQVINYLKASGHAVGLSLNFGTRSLEHRRLVVSPVKSAQSA